MIFLANQHSKIFDIDGKLIYSDNEMEITNFVMLLKLCKKREFGLTRKPNVVDVKWCQMTQRNTFKISSKKLARVKFLIFPTDCFRQVAFVLNIC